MSKRRYYNFDSFRVDATEHVLLRDGKPVALPPKVFDTLLALVERNGHIVGKDELVEIVWPDVYVEENNLTQYVAAARRALGDTRQEQRYIETVPKRGYRFAPSVRLITEESDSVLTEEQESLRIVVKDRIEEHETTGVGFATIAQALAHHRVLALASFTVLLCAVAAGYFVFEKRTHAAISGRVTRNAQALADYEEGRRLWNRRKGGEQLQAAAFFEKSINDDPNFALAYVGLADCYAFDWPNWKLAEEKANKALEIDPHLGEAHATIGFVRTFWLWDFTEAERQFKLAFQLSPNYATAHQWYAAYYLAAGRAIDAKHEMQRALALEPASLAINADLCQTLYYTTEYDAALAQCQRALALDPTFINTHIYLQKIYAIKGMGNEALQEILTTEKLRWDNPDYVYPAASELTDGLAKNGVKGLWQAQADYFARTGSTDVGRAETYALAGDKEKAYSWLERAYQDHEFAFSYTVADPIFVNLRGEERFNRLAHYKSGNVASN
jgi:DNA-binding winged helix-turn-helix (wHTH) protein/tetratricopeptide (TPR) repeat protein